MKLNKFFRENTRVLLIVFMSLLLVVFLLGDVISWMGRGDSQPDVKLGAAYGQTIYQSQLAPVEARMRLLSSLGMRIPASGTDPALTFHLLSEEARRMGIQVSADQVVTMLSSLPANQIDAARRERRMSLDAVYAAVADALAIDILANMQQVSVGDSEPRLRLAYRNQSQEGVVRVSVIDAAGLVKSMPEPTEAEVAAHFAEAKDRADAHTEEKLVFGYKIPDRVRVEYLTVDPEKIKQDVRVYDKDMRDYFEKNSVRYTKPAPAATSPANPEPQTEMIPMTFDEARPRVEEDCRAAKAVERAMQVVNDIRKDAFRGWEAQPRGADRFREPPPADKIVAFTELRDRYSRQLPVTYGKTELLDASGFATAPDGLAAAAITAARQRVSASQLAFRSKGLYTPAETDALPYLNLNEPTDVMIQTRPEPGTRTAIPYKAFIMRVVEVVPAGPPASIDEVREKIVNNLKLTAAFAEAEKQARALAERAYGDGLDAAVAGATDLRNMITGATTQPSLATTPPPADVERFLTALGPTTPQGRFGRSPAGLVGVPRTPKLHSDLFAMIDGPFSTTAPVRRIALAPAVRERKWVVAELLEIKPLYDEEFEQFRQQRQQRDQQQGTLAQQTFDREWFAVANVYQRTGFVPAEPAPQ